MPISRLATLGPAAVYGHSAAGSDLHHHHQVVGADVLAQQPSGSHAEGLTGAQTQYLRRQRPLTWAGTRGKTGNSAISGLFSQQEVRLLRHMKKILLLASSVVVAAAGAAYADTGTYDRYGDGVVFYWGISSGDANSSHTNGGPNVQLCQDVPRISSITNNFYSELRRDRTFQSDVVLRDLSSRYNDPKKCAASYNTATDNKYHVHVIWTYADAPDSQTGYGVGEGLVD